MNFIEKKWYRDRVGNKYYFMGKNQFHKGNFPLIFIDEHGALCSKNIDGKERDNTIAHHDYDIIAEYNEPKTIEAWVNVYAGFSPTIHPTKLAADTRYIELTRIACVPVKITYREGEGL